jgi:hypothetical protein
MLTVICADGQNLVGYNERDIKRYMKENRSDMNFNNVANSKFRYLKYSDNSDSQTLLFFFNADSVCKSVRIICDVRIKDEKEKEFNSFYKKTTENTWIDKRNGKDYLIEMKYERWSWIITIEPEK